MKITFKVAIVVAVICMFANVSAYADKYTDQNTSAMMKELAKELSGGKSTEISGDTTKLFKNIQGAAQTTSTKRMSDEDVVKEESKTRSKIEKIVRDIISSQKKEEHVDADPCEAYKVSYEAYIVCQDRTKKIQRMIDARDKRQKRYKKRKR